VGFAIDSGDGVSQPLIEHWNGSAWSVVPRTAAGAAGGSLTGVAALSASDAWAVGVNGNSPLIEHWNGSAWQVVSAPAGDCALSAVAALASNNVWAVGGGGANPLVAHWNGSRWSALSVAAPTTYSGALTSISALSASDIWAVGSGPVFAPHGCGEGSGALIEHWDGARWSNVTPA